MAQNKSLSEKSLFVLVLSNIFGNIMGLVAVVFIITFLTFWQVENLKNGNGVPVSSQIEIYEYDTLENVFSTPELKNIFIPDELLPLYSVKLPSIRVEQLKYMIKTGLIGHKASGAVPILETLLINGPAEVRDAASESLAMIGTNNAKTILEKHKSISTR